MSHMGIRRKFFVDQARLVYAKQTTDIKMAIHP